MALVEEGRVCIKRLGRDAGSKAVVAKVIDSNYVQIISSVRPKARRCNVRHLEFLQEKVSLGDKVQVAKTLEIDAAKLGA